LLTAKTIGPRFQERLPIGYWDGELCSTELAHHGEVNSDDFALAVEKRTTRAADGRLGIVNDLVGQDVVDVTLRDNRAYQVSPGKFFHHRFRLAFGCSRNGPDCFFAAASKNCIDPRGYPKSTTGPPLTAERSPSAKATSSMFGPETLPSGALHPHPAKVFL
jgi:hypothetical protein